MSPIHPCAWAVPTVGLALALALARATLTTVTVQGSSMEPTMSHGDVWLARRRRRPRPGRLASAVAPAGPGGAPVLVKRIVAVNAAPAPRVLAGCPGPLPPSSAWLLGDNARCSVDSRLLGPFPLAALRAYPVLRLKRGASTPLVAR